MKQALLLLYFLSMSIVSHAQESINLDSIFISIDTLFQSSSYKGVIEKGNVLLLSKIDFSQDTAANKAFVLCGKAGFNLRNYEVAKTFYSKAARNLKNIEGLTPKYLVEAYTGLGLCYKRTNVLDSSAYYAEMAVSTGTESLGADHIVYQNSFNNLGNTYRILGDFGRAIDNHNKALDIKMANYDSTDYRIGDTYNNMALIMHDLYEFGKAKIYYKQALSLYQGQESHIKYRQALVMYNMARIHYDLKDYEQCDEFVNKAVIRMDELGYDNRAIYYEMLTLQSNSLAETGNFEEAKIVLDKTILKKSKILKKDDLYWNYTYTSGAIVAAAQGNFDEAISYLNKSLRIAKLHYDESHPEIINLYSGLADYALSLGDLDQAESYISEMETRLGQRTQTMKVVSKEQQLLLWQKKALYNEAEFVRTKDQTDLTAAISSIDKAFLVLDNIKGSSFEQKARTFIAENHEYLFENALDIYSKQWNNDPSYIEKSIQLIDGNRNAHLRDAIKQIAALDQNGIPLEILEEGTELKEQMINIKESLSDQSEISIEDYEKQIIKWENYQSKMEVDFPEYYQKFYKEKPLNFTDLVQEAKSSNLAFVEFHLSDHKLYRFVINAVGVYVDEVIVSKKDIQDHIAKVRSVLYNVDDIAILNIELKWIHDHIFSDLEAIKNVEQVVIIPDGDLNLIPFEMLHDGQEYLINKYAFTYAYSLHMWNLVNENSATSSSNLFAGFAPSYNSSFAQIEDLQNQPITMLLRNEGERLPGALDAVSSIGRLLGGKTYIGENATEERFKNEASKYGVVHLAVHGLQDEDNPLNSGLLFENIGSKEDGLLTASEVSKMHLNAELAVLSACNSGWGKLNKNEGLQSLGYAFAYAGVPSNVMSLWKVPDESTSEIMKAFYVNLKSGLPKNIALQRAKLKYLDEVVDPRQSHPLYWSGFILNGNMDPVSFTSTSYKWWIICLSLLILGFILLRIKKVKYAG